MTPEIHEYVQFRVERAKETFEDAKLVLEQGHLHSAINRLYYTCFYLVSALLFTEGLSSYKHSGVRSLFDRYWIRTGRLPVKMSEFYRQLFNRRQQADYADRITFTAEEAQLWFMEANDFINRLSLEIQNALNTK